MNLQFAASLFDSPWLLVVFIIVGMISNWLMKRRQEKEQQDTENEPPPLADKPKSGFDLEDVLRRLIDEESPAKPSPSPPPIIPRPTPSEAPPRDWEPDEFIQPERDWQPMAREDRLEAPMAKPPPPPSPPLTIFQSHSATVSGDALTNVPAAANPLLNKSTHPPPALDRHAKRNTRATVWRNPHTARQAFVASLVFGPPKGLEN